MPVRPDASGHASVYHSFSKKIGVGAEFAHTLKSRNAVNDGHTRRKPWAAAVQLRGMDAVNDGMLARLKISATMLARDNVTTGSLLPTIVCHADQKWTAE